MRCAALLRAAIGAASLFIAATASAGSAADEIPDVAALRARIAQAAGAASTNFRETIVGGTLKRTTFRRGADQRAVAERGPIHTENGTYQGERWHQDANGLTVVDAPDPADAPKPAMTTVMKRVSEPVDAYVLSTLDASGYGTRTFVDPVTFQMVRFERITAIATVVTSYTDFTSFGSRRMAAHWTVTDQSTHVSTPYTLAEYSEGSVGEADVMEPPIRRDLVEFPGGMTSVELPTQFVNDRILVHVTVGGEPLDFLLDTGASGITIDVDVAHRLGLTLINGSSGFAAGPFARFETVAAVIGVGPLTMRNVVLSAIPAPPSASPSSQFAGILGFDFLAELGVTIDYQHKRVVVTPALPWTPPHGANVMPLDVRLWGGVPLIGVRLNGVLGERFVLDTGSNTAVFVGDAFARRHGDLFTGSGRRGRYSGIGGEFATSNYAIHDVMIARVHFHDFAVTRSNSVRSYSGGDLDGLVGTAFLRYFTLDLHYADGTVYLTRNAQLPT